MNAFVTIAAATLAIITTIVGTTIAIDGRYAKAQDVKEQFCEARKQNLKDRIFEMTVKRDKTDADKTLLEYWQRQLEEKC